MPNVGGSCGIPAPYPDLIWIGLILLLPWSSTQYPAQPSRPCCPPRCPSSVYARTVYVVFLVGRCVARPQRPSHRREAVPLLLRAAEGPRVHGEQRLVPLLVVVVAQ